MTTKRTRTRFPYITKVTAPGKDDVWHYRRTRVNPTTKRKQEWDRKWPSESAARDYADQVAAEIAGATPVVKRGGKTVEQACSDYLQRCADNGLDSNTIGSYRTALDPLRGTWPNLPVDQLTTDHLYELRGMLRVQGWMRRDGRPGAPFPPKRANYFLKITGQMLSMTQGREKRNVADLVDRIKERGTKKERPTFTRTQAEHLLSACEFDPWKVAWRLAFYGLRRGEIAGLRWEDVDFAKGTISISRARVVNNETSKVEIKPTKSEMSERTLPMSPALAADLQRTKEIIDGNASLLGEEYVDSGWVVVYESGIEPSPSVITDTWVRALVKHGLPVIHLHDARHTCTTLMFQEKDAIPQTEIARWLGHANTSMLSLYGHSQTDALMALGGSDAANL